MHFSWISTTSFITLNKREVKHKFSLHYWQYKIDTASVYKVLCFSSLVESAILQKIKVVSIEHFKQN